MNVSPQVDPVRDALELVLCLHQLVNCTASPEEYSVEEASKKGKRGEAIRRRARDLPSLMASAGLVSSLTFYMSKTDEFMYNQIYRSLKECIRRFKGNSEDKEDNKDGKEGAVCLNLASSKEFREEISSEGRGGYSTLTAVVAIELEKLVEDQGTSDTEDSEKLGTLPRLTKALLDILASKREVEVERYMIEFLTEVKKLADAYFQ